MSRSLRSKYGPIGHYGEVQGNSVFCYFDQLAGGIFQPKLKD